MAIIFELWAECKDEADARRLASHFDGLQQPLLSGRSIIWSAGVPSHDPAGVSVWSPGLSRYGVRTLQDALETTEAGLRLYHHLLSASDFRYARVAWEAANIPLADLEEWVSTLADGRRYLEISCVLDDALKEELGRPIQMGPFRPGYHWQPYRGESYAPLSSADHPELWALRRELLPA